MSEESENVREYEPPAVEDLDTSRLPASVTPGAPGPPVSGPIPLAAPERL